MLIRSVSNKCFVLAIFVFGCLRKVNRERAGTTDTGFFYFYLSMNIYTEYLWYFACCTCNTAYTGSCQSAYTLCLSDVLERAFKIPFKELL